MRARRFVPLMAAAFLLVPAMPASAHIQLFDISQVVGGDATPGNWEWFVVHGVIDCAEGESFLVTAKVIDDDFIGKGRTRGTCTGNLQGWSAFLQPAPESGFGDGCYERAAAKAHTKIDGVGHDEAVATEPSNCPPPP